MVGQSDWRHVVVLAAGFAASLAAFTGVPRPFVFDQIRFAWLLIIFLLPTTAAVIDGLLGRLWMHDPVRDHDPSFDHTYRAIVFRIVLCLLAIHALVLTELARVTWIRAWAGRLVLVFVGLTLIAIGNLLPRMRPNVVIGIRTSRTLTDRRLWMQMHRVGGYVSVGLGSVIALSGAFLPGSTMPAVINTTGGIGLTVLLVQYRRYRHA